MKKTELLLGLALLTVSCARENDEIPTPLREPRTFEVAMEETRVHLDWEGDTPRTVWTQNDAVSVFDETTDNQKFNYQGEETVRGRLVAENADPALTGESLAGSIYAAYPYASVDCIRWDAPANPSGLPSVRFIAPAVQHYRVNSFGTGANLMIARETAGANELHFQNLCGYLGLRVLGNRKIGKITLTRDDGSFLAGSFEGLYREEMTTPVGYYNSSEACSSTLTLDCGDGVQLNEREATVFIFAIPVESISSAAVELPMQIQGFTVKLYDTDGGIMTQTTAKSVSIRRNTLQYMAPFAYQATEGELEAPAVRYEIGDIHYVNGVPGIVFEIDESGTHGKVASLDEIPEGYIWSGEVDVFTYADDRDDGMVNMATIRALDPTLIHYPAFEWCASKGDAWYLPAVNELKSLVTIRETLNQTLAELPYATPLESVYITSTTEICHGTRNDGKTEWEGVCFIPASAPDFCGSADKDSIPAIRAIAKF